MCPATVVNVVLGLIGGVTSPVSVFASFCINFSESTRKYGSQEIQREETKSKEKRHPACKEYKRANDFLAPYVGARPKGGARAAMHFHNGVLCRVFFYSFWLARNKVSHNATLEEINESDNGLTVRGHSIKLKIHMYHFLGLHA